MLFSLLFPSPMAKLVARIPGFISLPFTSHQRKVNHSHSCNTKLLHLHPGSLLETRVAPEHPLELLQVLQLTITNIFSFNQKDRLFWPI